MRTRDKIRLARHITYVWGQATETEREEGLTWYRSAHRLARALCPEDVSRGAAVIAALSPLAQWERNMELAVKAFDGRHLSCLSRNAVKAQRIVAGEDPGDVLKGDKVRAFWKAITDPDDPDSVVVDRHAVEIAVGKVMTDDERDKYLEPKGGYAALCERYRLAAELIGGVSPVDVQAVTWVVWRRLKKGLV